MSQRDVSDCTALSDPTDDLSVSFLIFIPNFNVSQYFSIFNYLLLNFPGSFAYQRSQKGQSVDDDYQPDR